MVKIFGPTGKERILIRTEICILPVSTSADPHIRILPPARQQGTGSGTLTTSQLDPSAAADHRICRRKFVRRKSARKITARRMLLTVNPP